MLHEQCFFVWEDYCDNIRRLQTGKTTLRPVSRDRVSILQRRTCRLIHRKQQFKAIRTVKNDRRVMTNELFKRTSAEFYVEMRCNSLWTLRTSIAFSVIDFVRTYLQHSPVLQLIKTHSVPVGAFRQWA
jgi:hypothetical protein